jgi:hypothetical protein
MGDRPNCGSSEFRGTCVVVPKSERQTVSYVDLGILLNLVVGVDGYEVGRFGESIHDHPD